MPLRRVSLVVGLVGALFVLAPELGTGGVAAPTFLGPTPYLSAADSPFDLAGGNYCLEDFEDAMFDVPDVTGNGTTIIAPANNADSVDADDGVIDGFGQNGHSYFGSFGSTGITFTFDDMAPGGLPTEVGVVWTDGIGTVTFEAFGAGMVSLGTMGPFDHPDGVTTGTTAEDRFYGVLYSEGIAAVKLTNTSGGIEVDHLQYKYANCPTGGTTTTTSTATTTSSIVPPTTSTSSSTSSTTSSSTIATTSSTSTSSSTSTTSSSTTTSVVPSTTTTTLAGSTVPLPGKKLLVKQKKSGQRLQVIAKATDVTAMPPCEVDGELTIEAAGAPVRRYPLAADFWKPINRKKPEKGCKYRKGPVVATVLVKTGKVLKVVANADDLGIPLDVDARPVRVAVRHGDVRHCVEFGGQGKHKPGKKLLAKNAGPPTACPGDAPSTAAAD